MDYKVSIGAEVRTGDIDKDLKKYDGKVNVTANKDSLINSIDAAIKGYKPPHPIEVKSKLNTEGIKKAIQNYKTDRLKAITVQSDLDTDGIDNKINTYTPAKPIRIDVELSRASINEQIRQYNQDKAGQQIIVDAKLNDGAIEDAIKNYQAGKKIPIDIAPNFEAAEKLLDGYTARTPLKVNVKLLKQSINDDVAAWNKETNLTTVILDAKIKNGALSGALDEYKAKHPNQCKIPIDLELGKHTELDNKLDSYKKSKEGTYIPVRLEPAKDFDSLITKKPVNIKAKLEPEEINTVIEGFKASKKINVGVKLDSKDVNAQVAEMPKPTELINVDVNLDEESVNTSIALFQPKATLGVKPDLILEDVDDQIRAYVPKEKIRVNVLLDNDNTDANAGNQIDRKPIEVNVKLNNKSINDEIKTFKTNAKIKVGVKLDFASHKDKDGKKYLQEGIAKQIKDYQAGSKIKVGVELDRDSIIQEINNIKIDTPIKLGVELDQDGVKNVKNQINDLKQKLEDIGNAIVNISGNIASNNAGTSSAQQAARKTQNIISDSAKRAIKNISSKEIEEFFEVSDIDSGAFEDEMNKLVKKWTNNKGNVVDIQIETKTRFDEDEQQNIEELSKAHVTYKNAANESIKKTLEWKQIGVDDDGKTAIMGWVEGHATYRSSIEKTKAQTDKFVKQQKKAVGDLTNQINQINRSAIDQNASRPIKEQSHLNQLEAKYREITNAIAVMGNASKDAFDDEQNRVKRLISEYKSMKSEFQNAENVAGKLSGDDYESGRKIAAQRLGKLRINSKNYSGMTKTIEDLDKALAKVGDASSLKEFNSQLRIAEAELAKVKAKANAANLEKNLKIDVSGLTDKISNLQNANPEIAAFTTKIDNAEVSIESLLNDLSQVKTKGDFSVVNHKFNEFAKAAKNAGIALNDTVVKIKTVKDIKNKLSDVGFNGFAEEIKRAHADVDALEMSSDELESALRRVNSAFDSINTADEQGDMKALVAANEEYEESLKRLYSIIALYKQTQKDAFDTENLELDKEAALLKLENIFEKGSRAAAKFGARMEELNREIHECANDADMKKINKKINILDQDVNKSGLQTKTIGSKIKEQVQRYSQYLSVASVVMYAEQAIRSMFEQVKLIDSAMTELKKVTDETDESYNQFLNNAASRAKELGTTIDGLVSSTADFARLGYSFEESQGLAEVANVYAVVGDEIEGVEDATQSLVSTLAAFRHEIGDMSNDDFAMSIVDKMNEVSNNYAISSGGIGEALQRSASSMAAANNTLDETIALITAANEVAQNPEKVGKVMPT